MNLNKPMSRLHYERAGKGETLVLVHGYLGGSVQWRAEIEALSQYFDVIAVDLAGYGRSNHLQAPNSIVEHGRMVLAHLDALGVERFHLLGHSMGGMIVQDMVRQAPQRVMRLVLYATGPQGSIPGRFEPLARSRERLAADGAQATARRISAVWLVDKEASPAYEALADLACQASEQASMAGLWAMEGWDGRDHLSAIEQTTLVVWGDRDRSYGWSQIEKLWRDIPNTSLAVVPDCCHALHLERPALFHDILIGFLTARA